MGDAPYLSVVAGSRNDDHGGGLLHRMQVFIEALCAGCDAYGVDAELVLVEWNPPPDRPRLREALRWPRSSRCAVRIVEVPHALHAGFGTGTALPMHQMIAKNVGIRRARGAFVLATNIDIVLSEAVWERIARRDLLADRFYRVDRCDVASDVPESRPLTEQLDACRATVFRRHERDATRDLRDGTTSRIWRPMWQLVAGSALSPLAVLPVLREPLRKARRSLSRARRFGRLHTNASGDFTLLHRDRWHELGGYWEYTGFPLHVDGLLCYAAKRLGLSEEVMAAPACAYHIDHGHGTGYQEYHQQSSFWTDHARQGITRLTGDEFAALVDVIHRDGRLSSPTQHVWGLAEASLVEVIA